jgi:DNA invertase Pin-like site-specific DNA recombinase
MGAFAEFETTMRKERQAEGSRRLSRAVSTRGRPRNTDPAKIKALRDDGLGASEIARKRKVPRAGVYRGTA